MNETRFARVLCDNSDLARVQRDVFALADFPDDFVSCSDIPAFDLSPWRENPEGDKVLMFLNSTLR